MGNWNQNEFEYLRNTESKKDDRWENMRNRDQMEDGKEKQNDKKSLNATFSNELNNQRHETNSGEEQPQSKRTKSRRNNSEKKQKNKSERQKGQAPKLPPRGYSENECQPLIGVLNKKNDRPQNQERCKNNQTPI